MKHTKKLIAILLCMAMALPLVIIPVSADGTAEEPSKTTTKTLYSAIFDGSDDADTKYGNWTFSNTYTTNKLTDDGLLIGAGGSWNPVGPNAGEIPATNTFTLKIVYRHTVAITNKDPEIKIVMNDNNGKAPVSYRAFENTWSGATPAGTSILTTWKDGDSYSYISKAYLLWICLTLTLYMSDSWLSI